MIKVNVHEAKTHLSTYLSKIKQGERVLICKRNIPIAELRSVHKKSKNPRPFGLAKGMVEIPKSFFDPLPDDIIESFSNSKKATDN